MQSNPQDQTQKHERNPYVTPQLRLYGRVQDLTAGGSGKHCEGHPQHSGRC